MWKVEVEESQKVKADQIVSILEAMKLEINVKTELNTGESATVEKLLIKPNDVVQAGQPLLLLRRA